LPKTEFGWQSNTDTSWQENAIVTDICADGSRSHGVCNDENNYEYIFYTDVNGDGNIDICNRADLGVRCHDSTTLSNKLKVITNGFGIQTTLNYKPLTDSSVYTKGPKKGYYPNISIQNARQVISSVTTDNAIGIDKKSLLISLWVSIKYSIK
jgi:hypothetical protein